MKLSIMATLALVVSTWLAPSAAAQDNKNPSEADRAKAREYLIVGKKNNDDGRYKDAVIAFREGLRLVESPNLVLGLAIAYHNLYTTEGQPPNLRLAIEQYRRYLKMEGNTPARDTVLKALRQAEPEWRQLVAAGLASDEPTAAPPPEKPKTQLVVSSQTPGARASIDGGALGEIGLVHEVTPGPHKVLVEAPGYFSKEQTDTAVEGRLIVTKVELVAKPARVAVKAPSGSSVMVNGRPSPSTFEVPAGEYLISVTKRGKAPQLRSIDLEHGQVVSLDVPLETTTQRKASYYVLGGAGVLLVAGTVTALVALSAQGEAEDIDAMRGVAPLLPEDKADYDDAVDRRDRFRGVSYVMFGTAVAAGVTGGLMYWFDEDRPEGRPTSGTVAPVATGDGVGAVYVGTF